MPNPENLLGKGFDQHPEHINSTGLNKGHRWSKKIIQEQFEILTKGKDLAGNETEIPIGTQVIIATIQQALGGNYKALKELLDRLEGTPVQTVNQNIADETNKPIIQWVDTPTDET